MLSVLRAAACPDALTVQTLSGWWHPADWSSLHAACCCAAYSAPLRIQERRLRGGAPSGIATLAQPAQSSAG
jgi:hypothetical protein